MHDPLGLIGPMDHLIGRAIAGPPVPAMFRVLPRTVMGHCSECGDPGILTRLLGMAELAVCRQCGPLESLTAVLEQMAYQDDADGIRPPES